MKTNEFQSQNGNVYGKLTFATQICLPGETKLAFSTLFGTESVQNPSI